MADVVYADGRARLCHAALDSFADAGVPAGDKGDLILQLKFWITHGLAVLVKWGR